MKGQYFMAAYGPAVRYSPHTSGLPLASGLSTKLWRSENPEYEIRSWPFSPG